MSEKYNPELAKEAVLNGDIAQAATVRFTDTFVGPDLLILAPLILFAFMAGRRGAALITVVGIAALVLGVLEIDGGKNW